MHRQLGITIGCSLVITVMWGFQLPRNEQISDGLSPTVINYLQRLNVLTYMELGIQTVFTRARGSTPIPGSVIILSVDDNSLEPIFFEEDIEDNPILGEIQGWPYPRAVHAQAIDLLMDAGAKAIIFDIVFNTPSLYGPDDDRIFAEALQRHQDQVVLAARCSGLAPNRQSIQQTIIPYYSIDNPNLLLGHVNLNTSANDVVYQLPSSFTVSCQFNGSDIPSLAEAALDASETPQESEGEQWIYYYGTENTFPIASYIDLLVPEMRRANLDDASIFEDRIVVIGATARILQDFQITPLGVISGPEIQANSIASLLDNRGLRVIPFRVQLLIMIAVGVSGGWLVTRNTTTNRIVLAMVGAIALWLVTAYLLFLAGWVIPVTIWTSAIIFSISSIDAVNAAIAERIGRLRLRETLERYVSAPIADEIMKQQGEFETLLKGRNLKVAVLFSDIRGFTTLSSQLSAEVLVKQLNEYLGAMVDVIVEEKGCVDKFIGDAVMAEFGSPVSSGEKQDALNAVKAALGMRQALATLRQKWAEEDRPIFFNGIGINFGEVVAGNIGSPQRLEYTAIGDTVNIASRVESLTKSFKTDLIITAPVYELLQDEIVVHSLGAEQLRGRSSKTELFEVVGMKGESRDLFNRVKQDYAEYRQRQAALATSVTNEESEQLHLDLSPNPSTKSKSESDCLD